MAFLCLWAICYKQEVVSPDDWLVSSIWFLLSTGQFAIGIWGNSLPVCLRWFDLLLFLPGGSCVALLLQHYLVSSSPNKAEKFCFEYYPQTQETISMIQAPHPGRLACCPTLTLILCAPHFADSSLGGWLVVPSQLSAFVPCPIFIHWEFGSLPQSRILQGWFSVPPHLHCWW
jgi:hypothetical protein